MTKVTELAEIDALADNDVLYVYDVSDTANPDKKIPGSKLRPPGVKITNYLRFEGSITIPSLAAGDEGAASVTVAGAASGDHAVFNLSSAPPANIAITAVWASPNTVNVRFRNTHASNSFSSINAACTAFVSRSIS